MCKGAVDKRNELKKITLQNLSINDTYRYESQRKNTNQIIRRKEHLYKKKMIKDPEINRCNPKILFNKSGNIKKVYKTLTKILTNKSRTLITDEK